MVYMISYDLNADTGNYAAVHDAIRSFGDCTQCLESSWLVSTCLNAQQIYSALSRVLSRGDRCFISQVNRGEYWGVTTSSYNVWEWLIKHLG